MWGLMWSSTSTFGSFFWLTVGVQPPGEQKFFPHLEPWDPKCSKESTGQNCPQEERRRECQGRALLVGPSHKGSTSWRAQGVGNQGHRWGRLKVSYNCFQLSWPFYLSAVEETLFSYFSWILLLWVNGISGFCILMKFSKSLNLVLMKVVV